MAKSDEWQTPPDLAFALDCEFEFNLEVCSNKDNRVFPDRPYMGLDNNQDALTQEWGTGGDVIFNNPPYSQLKKFIPRAVDQCYDKGRTLVQLIPAYTDTEAWDLHFQFASEIRFLKGRLRFWENGKPGKDTARFPSAIVVYRPDQWAKSGGPHIYRWDWKAASKV